jgi:hypothetical protein
LAINFDSAGLNLVIGLAARLAGGVGDEFVQAHK